MTDSQIQQLISGSGEFITKLSESLGQSGKYAFEALVKYQIVMGIVTVVTTILWITIAAITSWQVIKRWRQLCKDDYELVTAVVAVALLTVLLLAITLLARGFIQSFAPEYSAINYIITNLK